MGKIVTAKEMQAYDYYTIHTVGIPSMVLMERAAMSVVDVISKEILKISEKKPDILVVCGVGNNGGDGFAVARLLHLKQVNTKILIVGNQAHLSIDAKKQLAICEHYQIPILTKFPLINENTWIIDAIFGVGLTRAISGNFADVIQKINQSQKYVIAIDLPSGIDATTGEVLGIAVQANITVTFAFNKIGLTTLTGMKYTGETITTDIGIYAND